MQNQKDKIDISNQNNKMIIPETTFQEPDQSLFS